MVVGEMILYILDAHIDTVWVFVSSVLFTLVMLVCRVNGANMDKMLMGNEPGYTGGGCSVRGWGYKNVPSKSL